MTPRKPRPPVARPPVSWLMTSGASPGAIVDATGFHDMLSTHCTPHGASRLHDALERLDAAHEDALGRLPHEVL